MKNKQQPTHQIRIGAVIASIWEHESQSSKYYNVTFSRSYREKGEEEWKYSDSFGRDDLLVLAKVSDLAHTFIYEKLQHKD